MNNNTCKWLIFSLVLLSGLGKVKAQYLFTQSFANESVLSKSGWYVGSQHKTTYRDIVNGYAIPGQGSVHVSFTDLAAGDADSLIFPGFAATGFNDSFRFDHAHRERSRGADSMCVFYSVNGGTTMQWLHTYYGSETPDSSTLSTVYPTATADRFVPVSGAAWATKTLALPMGTNAIMLVFYGGGGDELYLDNFRVGQEPLFCTGPPTFTGMTADVVTCPGTSFYLLPDSFVVNPFITYEWKRSLDNGLTDPWTPATNGYGYNTPEFYLTGFSQSYWYRLEATCGSVSVSPAVHVVADSSYNCYCRTDLGGFCNTWITDVVLGNLNNSTACAGGSSVFTFYPPAPGTTDSLTAGDPYASIAVGTGLFGSWLKARVGFWIDYNRDGTYDSTEFSMINTDADGGIDTFNFMVPSTAAEGLTGLRVRAVESGSFLPAGSFRLLDGSHACTNGTSGEVEEYLVYIKPSPVCSAFPEAGKPQDTLLTICQGTSANLSIEGASFGQGITYQWETSADNGLGDPWHDVTGAEELSFQTPFLSNDTYYRLKVTCTNSFLSTYTSAIQVHVNPFYTCYCADGLGGNQCRPSTAFISKVSVSNTSINNTSGCSNTPGSYTQYDTSATTSDTVYTGQIITVNVTNTENRARVALWIDYDHSGTYDRSEYTLITEASTAGVPSSSQVKISTAALSGYTGMRIRMVDYGWGLDSADACTYYNSGETEDYLVNIQPAPACSGTPQAGSYPLSFAICKGEAITLNAYEASYGSGIIYEWQESVDSITWTTVTTGTGYATRSFTSSPLTDSVYYRLSIYCINSGMITFGHAAKVNIKPFYGCYCSQDLGAGYSCSGNEYISYVAFPGKNLQVTSTCTTPDLNSSYTYNPPVGNATDSVTAGSDVVIAVRYEGSYPSRFAVWIDYNQDAAFDASEYTLVSANAPSGNTVSGTISLPVSVLTGYTGMRVRATNFSAQLDSADACLNLGDGETEDYVIYLKPAVPCDNTISAGTLPVNQLMCPGKKFTITATGTTSGSGLTYQWQESDDNGVADAWDNVPGGSVKSLTVNGLTQSKYYRLRLECSNTFDSAFTNSMQIWIDTFYNCYDAGTDLGGGMCNNDYISNVSIDGTTLDNTTICNNTPEGARTVFPPSGSTTATLVAGLSYTINVTPSYVKSMGVWIDYNHNGIFETSEFTLVAQRSNVKSSATINVPAGALPGLTGMRVRTNEPLAFGFPVGGIYAGQAASLFYQGETEDYVILIDTLKPATAVTASGVSARTVEVSWVNGNGSGRLVVAKEATATLVNPVNGTTYTPDVEFASGNGDSTGVGNYVVYEGDRDNSVIVEGLDSTKTYEFYVYEYLDFPRVYFVPGQYASAAPLPVKLVSFTGTRSGKDAQLKWKTASEKNNAGFEVQRSSDARNFEKAGFVKGNGTTSGSAYQYTDQGVFLSGNTWYYRLKQVDLNAASAFSGVIRLTGSATGEDEPAVSPNPFKHQFNIDLSQHQAAAVTVIVSDVLGNTVIKTVVEAGTSRNHPVDASQLTDGVYIVSVDTGTGLYRYKVIKSGNGE